VFHKLWNKLPSLRGRGTVDDFVEVTLARWAGTWQPP
jgi:hypothetical protein